jgi:plastocyanin
LQAAAVSRVARICFAASMAALALGVVAAAAPGSLAKATRPKVVKVCDDLFTQKPCADQAPVGTVRVRKGGKVKWDWQPDFDVHNVTLKKGPNGVDKSKFRSQTTASSSYSFTKRFKKAGKYHFYCTVHPTQMTMIVRVKR